jgi:hypothetical protein
VVFVLGDEQVVSQDIQTKLDPLVKAKDYAEIDRIADGLRESKAQVAMGTWHLRILYRCLANLPRSGRDEVWTERTEFLRDWSTARPESITARVALAQLYVQYAWRARSSGFISEVTETGYRLFRERLASARDVLEMAKTLKTKCPVWWETMQEIALGQEWDTAAADGLFKEAVAYDPTYAAFYTRRAWSLLPRWYGKEGDWQKLATEAAGKLDREVGDELYARIGWYMNQTRIYGRFFEETGYNWPRVRDGLKTLDRKYPNSTTLPNAMAQMAVYGADDAISRPYFRRIGTSADMTVWATNAAAFVSFRSF